MVLDRSSVMFDSLSNVRGIHIGMFTLCPNIPAISRFLREMFSHSRVLDEDEQHWDVFAQNLPRGSFIMFLANEVATDLICDNPQHRSISRLIADVDNDSSVSHRQHDAEIYLHHQYIHCDPTQQRRIIVFRHLIQCRLKFAK